MEQHDLTCIGCPLGCALHIVIKDDKSMDVTGNTCPRGDQYARKELTDPRRIVTSTVRVHKGVLPAVSVKTEQDIPKNKIFDCMQALKNVDLTAPVHMGDIVLADVAGTGINVIATKNIEAC